MSRGCVEWLKGVVRVRLCLRVCAKSVGGKDVRAGLERECERCRE